MNKKFIFSSIVLLILGFISESKAITCTFTPDPNASGKYALSVTGSATDTEFTQNSCNGQIPNEYRHWFETCENITSIVFDENITSIGNNAFNWGGSSWFAESLRSVEMPNVKTIGDSAFMHAQMTSIYMPNVEEIGNSAFYDANKLTSIDMPNVKTIGNNAFDSGLKLQYIGFNPENIISIGTDAFKYAGNWTSNPLNCSSNGQGCGNCPSGQIVMSGLGCMATENCTGEYMIADGKCIKMPGCANYAEGSCKLCETGYYKKSGGCVSESVGCGAGYLGKDGECISSVNGCGAGYKDMGGFCNRIQYTPAEAAPLLKDDGNFVVLTFKK